MRQSVILLMLLTMSFSLSAQNIDLVIWAGQSNAQGRQGDAAQYPADPNNLDAQIRFNWTRAGSNTSNGWTTMGPQGGIFDAGHFGPEVTFSRRLRQADYNPAIFKYTRGNTSIFEDWRSTGDGGLYDDMITSLNAAITVLEGQGHTVHIRAFVWIQGEADSDGNDSADAYFDNLTTLINNIRAIANNNDLPILLGVDEQYPGVGDRPQILNAHQDIALNDDNIKFTSMYGYPKADITHLTPAGLISHGESIFETFQILVAGNMPSSDCILSSDGDVVSSIIERSWGQSFTTDCSGMLSSITFSAASVLDNSATFNLFNSADCSGTRLTTQSLESIAIGDNVVNISSEIYLEKEHTYYFEIISNTPNSNWRIHYSNTSNVFGNLNTTFDGLLLPSCGRNFPSFDLNFSVELKTLISGVDDVVLKATKLYPNPSNGIVNLSLDGHQNVSVMIFDVLGKLVYQKENISRQFLLNRKAGLYLVALFFEDGTKELHKLILQ